MTNDEIDAVMAYLAAAYPQRDVGDHTLAVYREQLLDLDADQARAAVRAIVSRSKFFPTIAEIREAVGILAGRPTAAEAWAQVRAAAEQQTRQGMDPIVRRAFDLVIDDVYAPTLDSRTRSLFLESYREECARAELAERRAIAGVTSVGRLTS